MSEVRLADLVCAAQASLLTLSWQQVALLTLDATRAIRSVRPGVGVCSIDSFQVDGQGNLHLDRPLLPGDDKRTTRSLRTLLDGLLECTSTSIAALRLCACRMEDTSPEMLEEELLAYLRDTDIDLLRPKLALLAEQAQDARRQGKLDPIVASEEDPAEAELRAMGPRSAEAPVSQPELQSLRRERDESRAQSAALVISLAQFEAKYTSISSEQATIRAKAAAAMQARDALLSEVRALRAQRDAELDELERLRARMQQTVELTTVNVELLSEVRQLRETNIDLAGELARLTARVEELAEAETREDSLRRELRRTRAERDVWGEDAEKLKSRLRILEQEQLQHERVQRELRQRTAELVDAQNVSKELRGRLEATVQGDDSSFATLEARRLDAANRAEAAETARRQLVKERDDLQTQVDHLQAADREGELTRLEISVRQLTDKLAAQEQELRAAEQHGAEQAARASALEHAKTRERVDLERARTIETAMLRAEIEERAALAERRIQQARVEADRVASQGLSERDRKIAALERAQVEQAEAFAAQIAHEQAVAAHARDQVIAEQTRERALVLADRERKVAQLIAERDRDLATAASGRATREQELKAQIISLEQQVSTLTTDVQRAKDLSVVEAEAVRAKKLENATAKLRASLEMSHARALEDLRAQHDVDLSSSRADTEVERTTLRRKVDELEMALGRATSERDAERAWRLDGEAASAQKIRELRRAVPTRPDVALGTYRGQDEAPSEDRKWWK